MTFVYNKDQVTAHDALRLTFANTMLDNIDTGLRLHGENIFKAHEAFRQAATADTATRLPAAVDGALDQCMDLMGKKPAAIVYQYSPSVVFSTAAAYDRTQAALQALAKAVREEGGEAVRLNDVGDKKLARLALYDRNLTGIAQFGGTAGTQYPVRALKAS